MKAILIYILGSLFLVHSMHGQSVKEISLGKITWSKQYNGVIAEYHPIAISLSSDQKWIVGTIQKPGEKKLYHLTGEWRQGDKVLLQERDEFDRLTGYVKGTLADDHADLEWISADQSRIFSIHVLTNRLIKVGGFKPLMEWIECSDGSYLSVQKMDYGWISGLHIDKGIISRMDGNCQDGQCSIWSGNAYNDQGSPVKLSCQQRSSTTYRILKDGKELTGTILFTTPLALREFSTSNGFMDLVYPQLDTTNFTGWLKEIIDPVWQKEEKRLLDFYSDRVEDRLTYRTSAWIEVTEENEQWVSGLLTIQLPDSIFRKTFLWLKKEKELSTEQEWLMGPIQKSAIHDAALQEAVLQEDEYGNWIRDNGYTHVVPAKSGMIAITDFHSVYGDNFQLVNGIKAKDAIKKKYVKYFTPSDK